MATIYNHVQMGVVDANGQINVIYPITTAEDVIIETSNLRIDQSIDNVQKLVENIGEMAFEDGDDVVFFGQEYDIDDPGDVPSSEIDDSLSSRSTTYSSYKINRLIAELRDEIRNK